MAQNTNYGGGSEDGGSWTTTLNLNVGYDMGGASDRQSGSTFKLFTLMEWLRQGHTAYGYLTRTADTFSAGNFTISCSRLHRQLHDAKSQKEWAAATMSVLEATRRSVNGTFVG